MEVILFITTPHPPPPPHKMQILRRQDISYLGFSGGADGTEPACQCRRHNRHGFDPWVGKIAWRRAWQPTPVLLPRESHGQRSLAGYSLWGSQSRTRLSTFQYTHYTDVKHRTTEGPSTPLLGVHPKHLSTGSQADAYTRAFTAALCSKGAHCPSIHPGLTDEQKAACMCSGKSRI